MITDPLLITLLLLALILTVPMICRKLHLPTIVGFLLVGLVVGPSVPFEGGLIPRTATIDILGKLGMIYIMFQSGSEIDISELKRQRLSAFSFGLYTFLFPFVLGVITSHYILHFSWLTSALMGAMYGSHTLMTYPIVSRYGLQRSTPVSITAGGTLFAISASLFVLAYIHDTVLALDDSLGLLLSKLILLLVITLLAIPRIARWFLRRYEDPTLDYMLCMVLLVLSAWLARELGMDAILGAFLCGVGLNKLLPNHSMLMHRITFVGNTIFVPVFLIGVGMMMDIHVFFSGWTTLLIAAVMIGTKLGSKFLAAWCVQKQTHISLLEGELIFGLSHATSAGTLAIVTIGYEIGIFSPEVLNASVIMILVLCTSAAFVTEHAAKQIALHEEARMAIDKDVNEWVVAAVQTSQEGLGENYLTELSATAQLPNPRFVQYPHWSDVTNAIEHISTSLVVYANRQPLNTLKRLLVVVPRYAEKEQDFLTCFGLVRRLANELGTKVLFYAPNDAQKTLHRMCLRQGKVLEAGFVQMEEWSDLPQIAKDIRKDDMLVLLSSRRSTLAYNPLFEHTPTILRDSFTHNSYLVVYPEQQIGDIDLDAFLTEVPHSTRSWRVVSSVLNFFRRLVK